MKTFKCGNCANGRVRPATGANRLVPFTQRLSLPVPDDLVISTCNRCGTMYPTEEEANAIYVAQRPLYERHQGQHVLELLNVLKDHGFSRREIETACGVTPTYLSHVARGRRTPSITLVRLLESFTLSPSEVSRHLRGEDWSVELVSPTVSYTEMKDIQVVEQLRPDWEASSYVSDAEPVFGLAA